MPRPPARDRDGVAWSGEGAGTCDLCGDRAARVLLAGGDRRHGIPGRYALLRCSDCRMVRTAPRPADPAAAYPGADYLNHRARTDPASRLFAATARRTATRPHHGPAGRLALALVPAARLGGPLLPGARLLDVGCGTGHAVAALRAAGVDAHGIEPDAEAVRIARDAGLDTVREGTLDDGELEPGAWDVVRFWHTLEHVPSPSAALRRAHGGLRPGGRVVACVPNVDGAGRRLFARHWDGLELPRHLHHFDRGTLAGCLRGAGFAGVRVRSVPVPGVLAGSLDAATRREPVQRTGGAMAALTLALYPVELALAAAGAGDGLFAVGTRAA